METQVQEKKEFEKNIANVEKAMNKLPTAVMGEELDRLCPLKHTFVDGMYIREIFMPKGTLVMSKIHKFKHPYFIVQGETSVLTENGVERLKAPFYGITERGTKRLLYMHEDTVWVTVHETKETNLKIIEEQIIAKTFDDLPFKTEEVECFLGEVVKQDKEE